MEKKLNETEENFIRSCQDAMMYVPGNCDLEIHYDYETRGYYAWKYSEERGEATPLYNTDYETKPIIRDSTIAKFNVDLKKCAKDKRLRNVYWSE